MPFESYRRRSPSINLSALVDVLFILIVFVILTASFNDVHAVDVELPGSASTAQLPADVAQLVVRTGGAMTLDGVPVGASSLAARLKTTRKGRATLMIIADGDVKLARATSILDKARAAGYTAVSIATKAVQ